MALRLYNTLTRRKELFEPLEPGKVGIYVCGPTVYKESHIGHAVGPVIFDALKKYLTYKGFQVKLVMNITDVDDKIINEAKLQGVDTAELAEKVAANYFKNIEKLGVDSVDYCPRATEHINDIIHIIQRLGERDAAYVADGDVYFDTSRCCDYGKLSHRRSEEQLEGSRELAGSGKRHSGDFALWKAVKGEDEVGWDSPWGRGRPGWHIECSAMSMKYLGETFDIHGGGIDLVFPHHENEIAQSETATGKPFARFWMHNGLTRLRTKIAAGQWKSEMMSKSLGNIRQLDDILEQYPGPVIRFFLLGTHYRRPIDFSDEAIQAVQKGMMNIYRLLERVERITEQNVYNSPCHIASMEESVRFESDSAFKDTVTQAQRRYLEALDDDFNTAGALAVLYELCSEINRFIDRQKLEIQADRENQTLILEAARMLTSLGQILGLFENPLVTPVGSDRLTEQLMELLIELRHEARAQKNFALADAIRDKLKKINVTLEDHLDKTTTWRNG